MFQTVIKSGLADFKKDDYDAFVRQARLMTSIHASIPSDLKDPAAAAKRRGEDPDLSTREDQEKRPTFKGISISSSRVTMKNIPSRIMKTQSAPASQAPTYVEEDFEEKIDEMSGSKENDPLLSPTPVPPHSPRRSASAKRPLSDLPCPTETECDTHEEPCNNRSQFSNASNLRPQALLRDSRPAERIQTTNAIGQRPPEPNACQFFGVACRDTVTSESARPAKRICSEEGKENDLAEQSKDQPMKSEVLRSIPLQMHSTNARKASAPSALGSSGARGIKGRVGLRRL